MWMPQLKRQIRDRRRAEMSALFLAGRTVPGGDTVDTPDLPLLTDEEETAATQARLRAIRSRHEREGELWRGIAERHALSPS